jgi:hypothetical protein
MPGDNENEGANGASGANGAGNGGDGASQNPPAAPPPQQPASPTDKRGRRYDKTIPGGVYGDGYGGFHNAHGQPCDKSGKLISD